MDAEYRRSAQEASVPPACSARRAALAVIVLVAADSLSLAFSRSLDDWQVWAARGGVTVHPYPFAAFLHSLGSALAFIATRRELAPHVIASAALLICAVFFFAYALSVGDKDRQEILAGLLLSQEGERKKNCEGIA